MAHDDASPAERIPVENTALAEWTARKACESEGLIRRLEDLGYEVAGRSEDEITEILKHPPTKARASRSG